MTFQEEYEDGGTFYEIVESGEFGDDELAFDDKKKETENDGAETIDYDELLEEFNEEEEIGKD